jgi:hypothetical protein
MALCRSGVPWLLVMMASAFGCYQQEAQPQWTGALAPAAAPGPAAGGAVGGMAAPSPSTGAVPTPDGAPVTPMNASAPGAMGSGFGASAGAGQAGAGADGSTPAAAPASTGVCNIPECFTSVPSQCLPMGECMSAFTETDINLCFANGVKVHVVAMVGTDFLANSQVLNPDGSLCFSNEAASTGNIFNATYRDAAGNVFATSTLDRDTEALTITCANSEPILVDNEACAPPDMMMMSMMMSGDMMMMPCPSGTCM